MAGRNEIFRIVAFLIAVEMIGNDRAARISTANPFDVETAPRQLCLPGPIFSYSTNLCSKTVCSLLAKMDARAG